MKTKPIGLIVVLCALCLLARIHVSCAADSTATSGAAGDEKTLWSLEDAYWRYVEQNDLAAYAALWHADFLGWPSVSNEPVGKDHITDWITSQTRKGLTFKFVGLKPTGSKLTGDVAAVFYRVTFKWMEKNGTETESNLRITHTWLKSGKDWQIIAGMSMPEPKPAGQ